MKLLCASEKNRCNPIPRRMEITAVLHFQSRQCKLPFAVCIYTCEGNEGLQREYSLCRWVSNRGASRPVGTRFCFAKSSVLYLCFRLTRERGWLRHLLYGQIAVDRHFSAAVGQADFVTRATSQTQDF